jgi:hypothetical protein
MFPKRAKIYNSTATPWTSGVPIWAEGYGKGPTSCSSGLGGLSGLWVNTMTFGDSYRAYFEPDRACGGDSGGPWGLRSGTDFVQFAVLYGRAPHWPYGPNVVDSAAMGAVIRPALNWVRSTMNGRIWPLSVTATNGSLLGYSIQTYSEAAAFGYLYDPNGSRCLDAGSLAPGEAVTMRTCDINALGQRWILMPSGDMRPYWASYLCATLPTMASGQALALDYCANSGLQHFRMDGFQLRAQDSITSCLQRPSTSVGSPVTLGSCTTGATNQDWGWHL